MRFSACQVRLQPDLPYGSTRAVSAELRAAAFLADLKKAGLCTSFVQNELDALGIRTITAARASVHRPHGRRPPSLIQSAQMRAANNATNIESRTGRIARAIGSFAASAHGPGAMVCPAKRTWEPSEKRTSTASASRRRDSAFERRRLSAASSRI